MRDQAFRQKNQWWTGAQKFIENFIKEKEEREAHSHDATCNLFSTAQNEYLTNYWAVRSSGDTVNTRMKEQVY